ncbi:hypothetical protein CLOM_g9152 [Closterium sp. NIES-68]|nr:hypothetical protein CLOM_g9152 [Closterium sp. NIES-68]GJP62139.1 hypothetical protein CLOP_g19232 [Closterium sp. NIES-67]
MADKYVYTPLSEVPAAAGQKVHVIGVVVLADNIRHSQGTDFFCTLLLADTTCHSPGYAVNYFAHPADQLPPVAKVGDIIRIHRLLSTVIHTGPLGTARGNLYSSYALFSGAPGASLHPYAFSHESFSPLSRAHQQLIQQLRLWAHGFPFPIRPLRAPEPLLTISSIDADIAFDLCVQVWHIVRRDHTVVLFVWDGTDLPLPSLSAPPTPIPSVQPSQHMQPPRTGQPLFSIGGRPTPPLSVLRRIPPLGSLLPITCNVEDPHWLLHRLHPSVPQTLQQGVAGGADRAGRAGEGGERHGEGGGRRGGGEDGEEGEEGRVAGVWQEAGVLPCWVRLRNIRAKCHGCRGDWVGIFDKSSRLSLVRDHYSDVVQLKSKYAGREASEEAHTRIGNMALWASINQHTRIARNLQPYSTLRQIYTHPLVPYRFRCAARVVFASALHPKYFTALSAKEGTVEGGGEGKRIGEEAVEGACGKLRRGEGDADVARLERAVVPLEDTEADVARNGVEMEAEEGEASGVGRAAPGKGDSAREDGSGRKRKWAAGLVLVLEDATGRLLVRLAPPNAEVFFSATAEELRMDAAVCAQAAGGMAALLGVSRDHAQYAGGEREQQGNAGSEANAAMDENGAPGMETWPRVPPSIDCCVFSYYRVRKDGCSREKMFQIFQTRLLTQHDGA